MIKKLGWRINKLKYRYYKWKDWRKYSKHGWFYNLLVLLGIKKNHWFSAWRIYEGKTE